jgi:hypothetical protein
LGSTTSSTLSHTDAVNRARKDVERQSLPNDVGIAHKAPLLQTVMSYHPLIESPKHQIGREIAVVNPNATTQKLVLLTLDYFHA